MPVRGFSQNFKNPKTLLSAFSQKSKNMSAQPPCQITEFRDNFRIFAKICRFPQKFLNFRKNLQIFEIFAKIGTFSQKSANFRKKPANFRKHRQIFAKNLQILAKKMRIFAKICEFSQETANFRNNRYLNEDKQPQKLNKTQALA